MNCPTCHTENPEGVKFCHECGLRLPRKASAASAERKHVTVLFSDVSGYTAMSEKLDPEEVTEIMTRIFSRVTRVVNELDGSIDKFIGDAVLAVFGLPKAHEDDAVRAILAAQRIHRIVEIISPEVEIRIGRPLTMHTGINSGLIVTGEMNTDTGKAGITGDTINLASRLEGLSEGGEILVGPNTYHAAAAYFTFGEKGLKSIKGIASPIPIYKVLARREHPEQAEHLHGIQADFIGRHAEMAQLMNAAEQLKNAQGSVISVCGDAGTGKSRLVEEFKRNVTGDIQWFEGFAYAHRQQTPYAPFIDLLAHVCAIDEGDLPDAIRQKLETVLTPLFGDQTDLLPYLGNLFALSYPEINEVSPEYWKIRLHEGIQVMLAALARPKPAILCLEDVHWADPSSLELLHSLLAGMLQPILFLCVHRPNFTLFGKQNTQIRSLLRLEIHLRDLSAADAEQMLQSLLRTSHVPPRLAQFIWKKTEGNPFYLEEVVNTLLETKTLMREGGTWMLAQSFDSITVPSTIQGVLTARLDRLGQKMKRILQEAAVIGREFFYDILHRISAYAGELRDNLTTLQSLDLIRLYHNEPDLEYIFKHALIQEVAYSGLLKKERREIHEQIAQVMEQVFADRLPEFYEALAFHYTRGKSLHKAVKYLMKSGKKSINRYASEEAHAYYQEAFNLLRRQTSQSREDQCLIIDILLEWAVVFYYRGDINGLIQGFTDYQNMAETLHDQARLGMFLSWLGMATDLNGKTRQANVFLRKALKIGEALDDQRLTGYACCWLAWNCYHAWRLDEARIFGERAYAIAIALHSEPYLYFKSLAALGVVLAYLGHNDKAVHIETELLEFGKRHGNSRSLVRGYICLGDRQFMASGNMPSALPYFQKAAQAAQDPLYWHESQLTIGMCYMFAGQLQKAQELLEREIEFCRKGGYHLLEKHGSGMLGILYFKQGRMTRGVRLLEDTIRASREQNTILLSALYEKLLGEIYVGLVTGSAPIRFPTMLKNFSFLIRHQPFAAQKAEQHLTNVLESARQSSSRPTQGEVALYLGELYMAKKRSARAKEYLSQAIALLEQCGMKRLLQKTEELMAALEKQEASS